MKKASEILLLIGGILEIVAAVGFLISGIVMILFGTPLMAEPLKQIAEEAVSKSTTQVSVEAVMSLLVTTFIATGIGFLFACVFSVIGAIVTFKASKERSKGLFIASMVFGILSGTTVATIGSIFGLIVASRE